jgi:hypothetical protein
MNCLGRITAVGLLAIVLSGCAIASRSDKFGADWDIGVGGILSYIADVHFKGSVGFSKTCDCGKKKKKKKTDSQVQAEAANDKEEADEEDEGAGDPDPLGIDHFL